MSSYRWEKRTGDPPTSDWQLGTLPDGRRGDQVFDYDAKARSWRSTETQMSRPANGYGLEDLDQLSDAQLNDLLHAHNQAHARRAKTEAKWGTEIPHSASELTAGEALAVTSVLLERQAAEAKAHQQEALRLSRIPGYVDARMGILNAEAAEAELAKAQQKASRARADAAKLVDEVKVSAAEAEPDSLHASWEDLEEKH